MKTDPIFYRLFQTFQTFPSTFFELIGHPPEEATAYAFRSVEIKQTAFRIDGVFIPVSSSDQPPILFAEVQFQKDPEFYYRLFSEITLYLRQYKPVSDWQAIVIYPTRSIEPPEPLAYRDWLSLPKIRRMYLDELELEIEPSLGVSMVRLVVEPEKSAVNQAKGLIAQAQQEISDQITQRKILELIETIVIYKFPEKSRQELEAMLGLGDLKDTRFYQEAKQEGEQEGEQKAKTESIPRLLQMGLSLEQIAQGLNLPVEVVKQAAQAQ